MSFVFEDGRMAVIGLTKSVTWTVCFLTASDDHNGDSVSQLLGPCESLEHVFPCDSVKNIITMSSRGLHLEDDRITQTNKYRNGDKHNLGPPD